MWPVVCIRSCGRGKASWRWDGGSRGRGRPSSSSARLHCRRDEVFVVVTQPRRNDDNDDNASCYYDSCIVQISTQPCCNDYNDDNASCYYDNSIVHIISGSLNHVEFHHERCAARRSRLTDTVDCSRPRQSPGHRHHCRRLRPETSPPGLRLNNDSNSNSHDNVDGAVIVTVHCHCESSPSSFDECSMQRQVAADLWTKPISLSQ